MINNSAAGDTVWVAEGIYKPIRPADNLTKTDSNNTDNSFVLKANVHIYGGFAGNETNLSQRNWNLYPTILSGDIGILNDMNDNCCCVVIYADREGTAYLDGFTITGGNANKLGQLFGSGGISIRNSCSSLPLSLMRYITPF